MRIREKLKIMLQMSAVLTYGATLPVVKVGRIAGQFTKPRSEPTEKATGLPSFRGHMVHDDAPTAEARVPDPQRMVEGYNQSAQTLNLLRAFTKGGYADLTQVHLWNKDFVASSPEGQRYELLAGEIERALAFMAACGIDLANERRLHEVDVFTSHEGLLLEYEEGLTRKDSLTGDWYDCSAHLLWIGERTRQLDGAHVEFFSGVHNPIGVKLGPTATPADAVELCERLNPLRIPGRLTYYARMGAEHVREALPPLLRAVKEEGHPVLWASDPMHANGIRHRRRCEDAPLRHDHGRARRVLPGVLGGRRLARRRPPRVHRRGRHRMPRRRRRRARGAPRVALPDAARPAPERSPVARPRVPPGRADARTALSASPLRIAIVGTGLIGASLGLAARAAGAAVRGWDPDAEALALAGELGAVDPAASLEAALADADLAVVAAPIGVLPATVREVLEAAGEATTVTDVGSTKAAVCEAAGASSRFVGGHPIAGLEAHGPGAAKADLFRGATWFLAPLAATDPDRYRAVHGFVASLGATPVAIDPVAHDALVAMTSHVPHVLANVVVNQAGANRVEGHEPLAHAGGSLRDMTRIAGANPRIWVDIFLDNAEPVRAALAEHRRRIEQVEAALARATPAFSRAGSARPRRTGGACSSASTRPVRCSGSACTFPTVPACSPGSRRRSVPSGSTSRTSSCTTCRPSGAAR